MRRKGDWIIFAVWALLTPLAIAGAIWFDAFAPTWMWQ